MNYAQRIINFVCYIQEGTALCTIEFCLDNILVIVIVVLIVELVSSSA